MAAIDTVTGISLLYDSVYEVTANVTLGASIDDVTDATFIMKTGGLLRFGASCTTTFTRCTFIETDTAYDLGFDHYYLTGNDAPRWASGCTAVFKGCKWLVDTNSAFDTHGGNECTWERDDYGNPCYFMFRSGEGSTSTFQLGEATIDGVVYDLDTRTLGIQGDSDSFNDFTLVGTNPLSCPMTNPYPEYRGGLAVFTFAKVKAVSVTIPVLRADTAPNEHSKSIMRLIDPIGRIEKTTGSATNSGVLEVYRTWENNYLDASTGTPITTVRALIHPVGDVTDVLYDASAATNTYLMKQFSQAAGSETVVTEPDYVVITMDYGYLKQIESISIGDTTNPDEYKATKLLFADPKITETTDTVVAAYTVLDNAGKFYDGFRYWEYTTPVYLDENAILSVVGSTLNWSDHNIYFGNFSANISHFGADYVAPSGTVGDEVYGGFVDEAPTADDTNVTYTRTNSDFSGWATYATNVINGIDMSDDGTKIFIFQSSRYDSSGAWLTQLSLSTAFDLSTATVDTTYKVTGGGMANEFYHMAVSHDGTTLTFWDTQSGEYRKMVLATAWDITGTITSDTGVLTGAMTAGTGTNHHWNNDGTKMYTVETGGAPTEEKLYFKEYTCSTAYDISTATQVGGTMTTPSGIVGGSQTALDEYTPQLFWVDDGDTCVVIDPKQQKVGYLSASTPYLFSSTNYATTNWHVLPNKSSDTISGGCISGSKIVTIDMNSINGTGTYTFYLDSFDAATISNIVGAPNSVFVNVGTNGVMSATAAYDTLETTGTVNFLHGTSTDMTVIDANGTLTSINVNGIVSGSRVQIYNVTQDAELANLIVNDTTYAYSYYTGVAGAVIDPNDQVRVRVTYQNGLTAKLPFETIIVASSLGGTAFVNQVDDAVYITNGIDGSTVTEFTADIPNVEIDVNDADGQTTVQRMYAWYTYFSAADANGIRLGYEGFVALDEVNYEVRIAVLDMHVQNTGTNAVVITGGRFYRDDGTPIFIAGNGPIQMEYGRAFAIETGVSGLTTTESAQLAQAASASSLTATQVREEIDSNSTQLASIKSSVESNGTSVSSIETHLTSQDSDADTINEGLKKASLGIPHNVDL